MKFIIEMKASDHTTYNAQTAIGKAYALLNSLKVFLSDHARVDPRTFKPIFNAPGNLTLLGDGVRSSQPTTAPVTLEHQWEVLHLGARLFKDCESFTTGDMLARSSRMNDVRFPVRIVHAGETNGEKLLMYDSKSDVLHCPIPNWSSIAGISADVLKAIAEILFDGYELQIQLDGGTLVLPHASMSWFQHGSGNGHSTTSTAVVTGIFLIAKQCELTIDGLKKNRVLQATLSDSAALEMTKQSAPFTCSITYSEASCHFPLISKPGKILIERVWDIKSQTELELK